jgi:hypothetical protein
VRLAGTDVPAVTLQTRVICAAVHIGRKGTNWQVPSSGGGGAGPGGLDGVRPVEQRLAAQPLRDPGGFADRGLSDLVVTRAQQVLGVVEQAVGQVVGGGVLAQESSTPGVFAAGDVRHGSMKRVASAVGDGSTVIRLIHDYLALASLGREGS